MPGAATSRTAGRSRTRATSADALLAAYADPARGYHDTPHLTEVLDRLDELPRPERFDRLAVHAGGVVPRRRSTTASPAPRSARPQWAERRAGRPGPGRSSPRWPGWSGSPRPTAPPTTTPTAAPSPTPTWRSWPRRRERYAEYVAAVRARVRPRPRRRLPRRPGRDPRATCSPSPTCSTRRTPASTGRPPPARNVTAELAALTREVAAFTAKWQLSVRVAEFLPPRRRICHFAGDPATSWVSGRGLRRRRPAATRRGSARGR